MRSVPPKAASSYVFERFSRSPARYPTAPIGTPQGWYDAALVSSLTIVSNKVSVWADRMGSFNFSQGTAGSRPLYDASPRTINGVTIPEFQSATTFLDSSLPRDSRTMTCFVVGLVDTISTARTILGVTTTGDGNQIRIATTGILETLKEGASTLAGIDAARVTLSTPFIAVQQLDASNVTHWLCTNGILLCAKETDANATTFTAGRVARMGTRSSGGEPFDGLIAEVVQYSSTLSDADVRRNLNYLAYKWAIVGP